jgi:hypothetical protein
MFADLCEFARRSFVRHRFQEAAPDNGEPIYYGFLDWADRSIGRKPFTQRFLEKHLEINRTGSMALKPHKLSATCGTSAGPFKRRPVGRLGDANCKGRSVISTLKHEEVCWRH